MPQEQMLPVVQLRDLTNTEDSKKAAIEAGRSAAENRRLRIPRHFYRKSLAGLIGHEGQLAAARSAIENKHGVFIHGACGTGKTHMAIGLLLHWDAMIGFPKMQNAQFLPVPELLFSLKRCYETGEGAYDLLTKFSSMPMLLLDDIGAERISDWSREVFSLIIDRRYREDRATIITSNLSPGEISTIIGDPIASRITEMCEVVCLDGPDRRVEGIAQQK